MSSGRRTGIILLTSWTRTGSYAQTAIRGRTPYVLACNVAKTQCVTLGHCPRRNVGATPRWTQEDQAIQDDGPRSRYCCLRPAATALSRVTSARLLLLTRYSLARSHQNKRG
jgi:hypothetical protein